MSTVWQYTKERHSFERVIDNEGESLSNKYSSDFPAARLSFQDLNYLAGRF